jgi:hypothetical protein
MSIVGVYAPNDDASVQDKEQYMKLLSGTVNKIGNNRGTIIVEDMNASTGKRLKHSVEGRCGENVVNNNDQLLIDFCDHQNLRIMNGTSPIEIYILIHGSKRRGT